MVRFTVLSSGSKGNSAVLTAGRTRILIDAGLSCRELFRRMTLAGEDPATLSAILITHEHSDHVNGLASFPAGVKVIAHEHNRKEQDTALAAGGRGALLHPQSAARTRTPVTRRTVLSNRRPGRPVHNAN